MFLTGGHGNTADHPNFLLRTGNGSEQIAEFHICIPILTALGELQGPYTCCIALQLLPSFGFRLSFSVFRDRQMLRSTPQCKIGKKPDGIESMTWMLQAISPLCFLWPAAWPLRLNLTSVLGSCPAGARLLCCGDPFHDLILRRLLAPRLLLAGYLALVGMLLCKLN
jgi:hypothetical protein